MRPWATLTPDLKLLESKKGPATVDDILQVDRSKEDEKNKYSKQIIAALPLGSKIHRDLAIDYMNPREELAQYVKSEDTIPAFDYSTLTMMTPEDDLAKQQIGLVKAGIQNWAAEENKYNPDAPDKPATTTTFDAMRDSSNWAKVLKQNLLMQHQTAIDQTSSL